MDAFPVDTWIAKILARAYGLEKCPCPKCRTLPAFTLEIAAALPSIPPFRRQALSQTDTATFTHSGMLSAALNIPKDLDQRNCSLLQ